VGAEVGETPELGDDDGAAAVVVGEGIKTVGVVAAAVDGAALGADDDGHGFVEGEDGD